jgi:hypothetical protein
MRQCPKCQEWTMDFDEYFRRFRCLAPGCGWMPPSTAEREIRLLQRHMQPARLDPVTVPELGLVLTPSYDSASDAISVDFGLDESAFDLPEADGRMIWRIGRRSNRVTGFTIAGVKQGAIGQVTVQFIARRKRDIEQGLRRMAGTGAKNRATRDVVDEVVVTALSEERLPSPKNAEVEGAWKQVVNRLEQLAHV